MGYAATFVFPLLWEFAGALMMLAFLHMSLSRTAKNDLANMIWRVVEAHPKVFQGRQLEISPTIPTGWGRLVDEFCSLLEAICDDAQLSSLQFHGIHEESGRLILDFTFGCELSEHQARTIEARVFALGNRSVFTCSVCGRLAETLAAMPVRCREHSELG